MSKLAEIIRNGFVWTYERGTLQYDILCALILAFVFLAPKSCFETKKGEPSQVLKVNEGNPSSVDGGEAVAKSPQKARN